MYYQKVSVCLLITVIMFSTNTYAQKKVQLYVSFFNSDATQAYIINKGFSFLPIIYQKNIDPDNDAIFDSDKFVEHVNKKISENEGIIALDWEGKAYNQLTQKNNSNRYSIIVKTFIEPLQLIKDILKNNVAVGYYGLPSRFSTNNNTIIEEKNRISELYSYIDILFPSLYLNHNRILADQSIIDIEKHLLNTLKIGCPSKKVFAFITHRWHPNSKYTPNALIPVPTFKKYITTLKNTNFNGCHLDGIVWWGADGYWYKKNKKAVRSSIDKYSDLQEYNQQEIENYANVLLQEFMDTPKIGE